MQEYKMLIDGKWINAESGKTYNVINPATEEIIASVPLGEKVDVDKAVEAARKAFPIWSKKTQVERSRIIAKLVLAIEENNEELAKLDAIDHGTPIKIGRIWGQITMQNLEFCAQGSRALMGEYVSVRPNSHFFVQREPIGVCGLIIPWNSPIMMVAAKVGAAISVGNTCIVKPSNIDSLTTLKFGEILKKLNIPPGVVNIVTGPGSTVGNAIASHPGIDMISFTGSSETGKTIMNMASGNLKRLHMELGGKNPYIVLENADIDWIIPQAANNTIHNTGMVCASPGRFYIHEKIYDEFVEKFVAEIKKTIVGDPNDEKTDMGPVVSAEHRERVESYIKSGVEEGAKLIYGGKRPTAPPLNKGYFVMPAVFTEVKPHMKIFREEIFGPVACFIRFSSDEEVIKSANDNIYALCASVWTRDLARGFRIVNQINAGSVGLNTHRFINANTPWGGFKESGFGKENSIYGLEEYTQLKMITAEYSASS